MCKFPVLNGLKAYMSSRQSEEFNHIFIATSYRLPPFTRINVFNHLRCPIQLKHNTSACLMHKTHLGAEGKFPEM